MKGWNERARRQRDMLSRRLTKEQKAALRAYEIALSTLGGPAILPKRGYVDASRRWKGDPMSRERADVPSPYPCPGCGETEAWIAHYMVPESQRVELFDGADGLPEEGDYHGSTQNYDPEGTDYYQCGACTRYIDLQGEVFNPSTDLTGV